MFLEVNSVTIELSEIVSIWKEGSFAVIAIFRDHQQEVRWTWAAEGTSKARDEFYNTISQALLKPEVR